MTPEPVQTMHSLTDCCTDQSQTPTKVIFSCLWLFFNQYMIQIDYLLMVFCINGFIKFIIRNTLLKPRKYTELSSFRSKWVLRLTLMAYLNQPMIFTVFITKPKNYFALKWHFRSVLVLKKLFTIVLVLITSS